MESVLFPEPFFPIMACTSPAAIERSMPLRISRPEDTTLAHRPRISSRGGPAAVAEHENGWEGATATAARNRRRTGVPRKHAGLTKRHPSRAVDMAMLPHEPNL